MKSINAVKYSLRDTEENQKRIYRRYQIFKTEEKVQYNISWLTLN